MSTTNHSIKTHTIHDYAMLYALKGFSVIPLQHKDKRPMLRSWEPYKTTPPTADEIDQWFLNNTRNIGIVTGAVSGVIVLDIDGQEGFEALAAIVSRFGDLPPTWVSATGKGHHYIFKYPNVPIRNSANRQLSIDFRGDGGYIVAPPSIHPSGSTYQWIHDQSIDIADAPSWLIDWMTSDRQPAWVTEILVELGRIAAPAPVEEMQKYKSIKVEKYKDAKIEKYPGGKADLILKNCAFCQHCEANASTLSEPEWYAMMCNIGRVDGGRELVHQLSAPYPDYSAKATDIKIDKAVKKDPQTCEYIQTKVGFTGCPSGGCGVKAPVVFATSELLLAQATMATIMQELRQEEKPSPSAVFDPRTVEALATIKSRDIGQYSILKAELKSICKDLSLSALEKVVKQAVDKSIEVKLAERIDQATTTSKEIIQKYDFGFEIHQPLGWEIKENGVYPVATDGETKPILPVPLFLTRRIINADSGEEKVQISFVRDEAVKEICVARPVAFNRSQLVTLSTHALPVTSENAKDVINYLHDFEAANLATLPVTKAVSRMGWIGSQQFMPGASSDVELDIEPGMASIASGYGTSGDLETWRATMAEARQSPIVRLMMSASFAAPMLKLVGHRVFLLHVWGASRGGKTASLKAALSVWGDPDTIMASFNSTRVGLERLASFYCDLPLGIDERQIVGNKQDFIDSLVYLIGMGKGKTRGTRGGGIQAASTWRTIALTTGEEPLSSESSNTGIRTRALEIYGLPFSDERLASRVHQVTKDHYGHAGEQFIRSLINLSIQQKDEVRKAHEQIVSVLQSEFQHHMGATITQLAMLALGDIWASVEIFGTRFELAIQEALDLVRSFAKQIATSFEADEALIGALKFQSWCASNIMAFDDKANNRAGFRELGVWYVYSNKFDTIMKELNFNGARMLRDWGKHGWIKTQTDGDKVRYRIKKWDRLTSVRTEFVAFVGVHRPEEPPEEEKVSH